MHFFNPVHKMKLLEIVRALETDADTLAAVVEVGKRMRKEVVVIKEAPASSQPHQRMMATKPSTCSRKASPQPKTSTSLKLA